MKYYKVKKSADQLQKVMIKNGHYYIDSFFIADELYTENEYKKMTEKYINVTGNENIFDIVEISKKKTYWFFGARFACSDTSINLNEKAEQIKKVRDYERI